MSKRSAVITGAAKRVGHDLAIGLAERGFDIGLNYFHSEKEATATQKEIEKLGRQTVLLPGNLADKGIATALIQKAAEKLSNIELLINNASIFERAPYLETDIELYEHNMALHVQAPFILTAEFAKICKRGNVINIVDTMINRDSTAYFAYLLSKKALYELTKMSAYALAPNIRVNAIAPGSTIEPVDEPGSDYVQKRAAQVPLKMAGQPSYILQGIDFLLSCPFVTGQCLFIDGGAHIEY